MFFIRLLGKLPLGILYGFSSLMALFICHILRYRRKVVLENLRNSFPEKSDQEIRKIAREFYFRFTDYAVETLKVLDMSPKEMLEHVDIEFGEELQEVIRKRQSFIMLTSHQFNWEWTLHVMKLRTDFPFEGVYQRLQNKAFDKYMQESRSHTGAILVEKSSIVKHVIGTRSEFKCLTMLADQRPNKKAPKHWTTFLHQETPFVKGPDLLAQIMNAPVFLYFVERTKRGHYNVKIKTLATPPYEKNNSGIIDAYARGLEAIIRNDPAGYLWSHKRWKLKRSEDAKASGK